MLKHIVSASKQQQRRDAAHYKFGVQIPHSYNKALALNKANGNTLWQDAVVAEREALDDNKTYHSIGKGAAILKGYHNIPVHFVFDCKEDERCKACLVAGGHCTPIPDDPIYSSDAALRSLHIVMLLAELNGLKIMASDIGYAYLQLYTKEKVAFVADASFGDQAGHAKIIDKAIYGLRSSGARFHEMFATTMRELGFVPSYTDPDVWMHDARDKYKYVIVYVDDLIVKMVDNKAFFDALKNDPHN